MTHEKEDCARGEAEKRGKAPIEAKVQAEADQDVQTRDEPQSGDEGRQTDRPSLSPPVRAADIEAKVHESLRDRRETLLNTLANTRTNCAQLIKEYNEMQVNNKELGDQIDRLESESKAAEK